MKKERLLSTKEVHELLVEMLQKFAMYCDEHGLRYHLVGGTLLGAIRHKGFIPWDGKLQLFTNIIRCNTCTDNEREVL